MVYRFHKVDKRWGNKYKIACSVICADLLSRLSSPVYLFQQLAGHNVNMVTSIMGFVNRATLIMSYMFFLNSLLDILEMPQASKDRILRLGLYLLFLYLVEMVVDISYSRFCTGTIALTRVPDDHSPNTAEHHSHLVYRVWYAGVTRPLHVREDCRPYRASHRGWQRHRPHTVQHRQVQRNGHGVPHQTGLLVTSIDPALNLLFSSCFLASSLRFHSSS